MNQEIRKELDEIEQLVAEAKKHEEYREKVFYVREGMLMLTGDVKKAILLSSLMGWTEHWLKTDNEIYAQIQEAAAAGDLDTIRQLKKQIRQGWFYKSYEDMAKDLLKIISKSTAERYCQEFEEKGWIVSKDPDKKATYRARWYKADVDKIRADLNELGYDLDYFKKQKARTSQNGKRENTGILADESLKPPGKSHFPKWEMGSQNGKSTSQNGKLLSYYSSFNTSSFNNQGDDDGSAGSLPSWETDLKYAAFRQVFTEAGADDIIRHDHHYPKYLKAVQEAGYSDLLKYAEEYIREHGSKAQICQFIGGEWKSVREKLGRKDQKEKGKLPKMVQNQMDQADESPIGQPEDESLEEKQARIREKIRQMNAKTDSSYEIGKGYYDDFPGIFAD